MKKCALLFIFLTACAQLRQNSDRKPSALNPNSSSPLCQKLALMEIHSHRGAADRAENMASAFLRAAELGADVVEMDLQVSKDGHLIVAHDPWVKDACLDASGEKVKRNEFFFRQLPLEEIKKFHCGRGAEKKERFLTLPEALQLLKPVRTKKGVEIGLNIEIKYYPHLAHLYPPRDEYARLVLDGIQKSEVPLNRIMIQSFDIEVLNQVRLQHPTVTLSPLLDGKNINNGVQIAQALRTNTVTPEIKHISPKVLNDFQMAGIRVIPWTVNSTSDVLSAIELGTNGAITDRPELFEFAQKLCGY